MPPEWTDYSAAFCQMYGAAPLHGEIPIYSYGRPASMFWSAIMNGLIDAGYTEAEAFEWCKSKSPRWALDGDLGEALHALAYNFGKSQKKGV